MTINRNNFEEYLLDYLEGTLDPLLTADLMAFLAENPEYENYLPERELHSLISEREIFANKDQLKKDFNNIPSINESNFDEFCIASSEGILDRSDIDRLNHYIGEDPQKLRNLELFNALKLNPDPSVIFPFKDNLKKPLRGVSYFRYFSYTLAVAASIAILFLLLTNRPGNNSLQETGPVISENRHPSPTSSVTEPQKIQPKDTGSILKHKRASSPGQTEELSKPPVNEASGSHVHTSPGRDSTVLASLIPVTRQVRSSVNNYELRFPNSERSEEPANEKSERHIGIESDNLFAELFSKIDFWKTAETAINGFNYLTESEISINKITDKQGKLTGLSLGMENYTIAGKFK